MAFTYLLSLNSQDEQSGQIRIYQCFDLPRIPGILSVPVFLHGTLFLLALL